MEDLDLECLPTNFEGVSRPSELLKAFQEKALQEHAMVMEEMHSKELEIFEKHHQILRGRLQELKEELCEARNTLKDAVLDCKLRVNTDPEFATNIGNFRYVCQQIQKCICEQHQLVEKYSLGLVDLEQGKAEELRSVLKTAYEKIRGLCSISPSDNDQEFECELKQVNEQILLDTRNYAELKFELELEIQQCQRNTIQELQIIRNNWRELLKNRTEDKLTKVKQSFSCSFGYMTAELEETTEVLRTKLDLVGLAGPDPHTLEWLENVRSTFATLHDKADKLMDAYKTSINIIYNRNFQHLKVIEDAISDLAEAPHYDDVGTFGPDLDEIMEMSQADLERCEKLWDEMLLELNKTVGYIQKALAVASTLWQRFYRRTSTLRPVTLKGLTEAIRLHEDAMASSEEKLSVLVDTLRQDPTEKALEKSRAKVRDLVAGLEAVFQNQFEQELAVLKKYKTLEELNVQILYAELHRFLELYPPSPDRDPTVQKRRASQISLKESEEGLKLSTPVLYAKYRIEAVGNWQFGLWNTIKQYLTKVKADHLAEVNKWVSMQEENLAKRLTNRLQTNAERLDIIWAFVYDSRFQELHGRQGRVKEHREAVYKELKSLKDLYPCCKRTLEALASRFEDFNNTIGLDALDTAHSVEVRELMSQLALKSLQTDREANDICSEFVLKCDEFSGRVNASHLNLAKNVKLFSEEGNFSRGDVSTLLTAVAVIQRDVGEATSTLKANLIDLKEEILKAVGHSGRSTAEAFEELREEHEFNEFLSSSLKHLSKDVLKILNEEHLQFKLVYAELDKCREEVANDYKVFPFGAKKMLEMLEKKADDLNLTNSMKMFARQSDLNLLLPPTGLRFVDRGLDKGHQKVASKRYREKSRQSAEYYILELSKKLFDLNTEHTSKTVVLDINNLIRNYWNMIESKGKDFYSQRQGCFFLDNETIYHGIKQLMHHMFYKFHETQYECALEITRISQEFLGHAQDCSKFLEKHLEIHWERSAQQIINAYQHFFQKETREALHQTNDNLVLQYRELQKGLKPLYAFPTNKILLEQLQIKSEIISSNAKEMFKSTRSKYLQKLNKQHSQALNDLEALRDVYSEVSRELAHMDDLGKALNEKIITGGLQERLKSTPDLTLGGSEGDSTDLEGFEAFVARLKDLHEEYCREVRDAGWEKTLEGLRAQWRHATLRVLKLYDVRYDYIANKQKAK